MKRDLTCIVCPIGCSLKIDLDTLVVSGNNCPRGENYAVSEVTNPVRILTTTIRCENGMVLPVKTNKPIPKDKIFECMDIINNYICKLPIKVGDVIINNVFGADIVATKNME